MKELELKLTKERIAEIRERTSYFEDRKKRAHERAQTLKREWWSFGIVGFSMAPKEYKIAESISLRPVQEPPGMVELASALNKKEYLASVAQYCSIIQYELLIHEKHNTRFAFDFAYYFLSTLRIKTGLDFIVPFSINCSFSTVAACENDTLEISLIENFPNSIALHNSRVASARDIRWSIKFIKNVFYLSINENFNLAFSSYSSCLHQSNYRMAIASVWTGIETIFGIESEIRFRASLYVAALIKKRGKGRKEIFKKMKELYNFRSKVIHGKFLKDELLRTHLIDSRYILSQILISIIQNGKMLTQGEIEDRLLV